MGSLLAGPLTPPTALGEGRGALAGVELHVMGILGALGLGQPQKTAHLFRERKKSLFKFSSPHFNSGSSVCVAGARGGVWGGGWY